MSNIEGIDATQVSTTIRQKLSFFIDHTRREQFTQYCLNASVERFSPQIAISRYAFLHQQLSILTTAIEIEVPRDT